MCHCEEALSYVNCSASPSNGVFITVHTDSCVYPTRRRRDTTPYQPVADNILNPDDIPLPVFDDTFQPSSSFSWPTASGITSSEADSLCRESLENLIFYSTCESYADIESIIRDCTLDIGVSLWCHYCSAIFCFFGVFINVLL